MRRLSILVVVAALAAMGCGPAGSGNIATVERGVPAFDRIHISEGLDLALEFGPGGQRVMVTYDDNLVDRISTEVIDGELIIEIAESFRVTGSGRFVTVKTPELTILEADSGADIRATGATGSVRLVASGGASLDFSLLNVTDIEVEASGGAYVAVTATGAVTGEASGGAEVLVIGDPARVEVTAVGGAQVLQE